MARRNSTPARKQPLYRQLVAGIGQKEIAASLVGMRSPRAERLAAMMFDPAYASLSLGQLCSRAGLSAGEVMCLYCQRQLAEGVMRMALHLPDLMEDIVLDSMGHDKTCEECEGSGMVQEHTCRGCRGQGEVRILGDNYRLRLVLEVRECCRRRLADASASRLLPLSFQLRPPGALRRCYPLAPSC